MAVPGSRRSSRSPIHWSVARPEATANPRIGPSPVPSAGMLRLLLFIGVPVAEIALLIWSGDQIGVGPTLGIIFLTGVAGASLVKRQGLAVWASARERLAQGGIPTDEMAH